MLKRKLAVLLSFIMVFASILSNTLYVGASDKIYVALGDSICRGYGLSDIENESYPSLLAKDWGMDYINYGVDGLKSAELLQEINNGSYNIANADVITVSIGSNDLLSPLIDIIANTLGVTVDENVAQNIAAKLSADYEQNPTKLMASIAEIKEQLNNNGELNKICEDFGANLSDIITAIRAQNSDCKIYVTNIYNPYYGVKIEKDYGTFVYEIIDVGGICETYINKINNSVVEGDYTLVDVKTSFEIQGLTNATKSALSFTGAEADIKKLDVDPHPNKEGYFAIYSAIKNESTVIWGDADGDGVLTAKDASDTLQYVHNTGSVDINLKAAGVSGSDVLTAQDAAMILQKVLDSSFKFPVEETTIETTSEVTTMETTTQTTSEETTIEETTVETTQESTVETTTEFNRAMYSLTGFGASNVGGGVIDESNSSYAKVSNVSELSAAITKAKKGSVKVIEITNDIALGSKEIGGSYSNISEHSVQPKKHPTLIKSGISTISLSGIDGLTIFSKNGATLKHGAFSVSDSSNMIIRNITFDELWEWDEDTKALYKKNDWDYITLQSCSNIWIDHCTFYKSYDGVVDAKKNVNGLTISWCYYPQDDMSEGSFVRTQIDYLEANINSNAYYKKVRNDYGFTKEEIIEQCAGHDKTHLLGSSELNSGNQNLQVTMYNNYYENCQQRMPRLRSGNVHVFNTVIDSERNYSLLQRLGEKFALVNTSSEGFHIVSDGCVSTEDGALLVENSNFIGVEDPLCNNKKSASKTDYTGKIKAVNMLYQLGNLEYLGSSEDENSPITIAPAAKKEFSWNGFTDLVYSYVLADPTKLKELLLSDIGCGSGKSGVSQNEWLEVKYN